MEAARERPQVRQAVERAERGVGAVERFPAELAPEPLAGQEDGLHHPSHPCRLGLGVRSLNHPGQHVGREDPHAATGQEHRLVTRPAAEVEDPVPGLERSLKH